MALGEGMVALRPALMSSKPNLTLPLYTHGLAPYYIRYAGPPDDQGQSWGSPTNQQQSGVARCVAGHNLAPAPAFMWRF